MAVMRRKGISGSQSFRGHLPSWNGEYAAEPMLGEIYERGSGRWAA